MILFHLNHFILLNSLLLSYQLQFLYDLFYLRRYVDAKVLSEYLRICIFEDSSMLENNVADVEHRLARIFSSKAFLKRMANPDYAWIDETVDAVVGGAARILQRAIK